MEDYHTYHFIYEKNVSKFDPNSISLKKCHSLLLKIMIGLVTHLSSGNWLF